MITFRTLCLSLILLGLWAAMLPHPADATKPETSGAVHVLEITGAIGPATYDYLSRKLEKAAQQNAELVILEMDTPGGLFSSTREIISTILASPVPVATYVSPAGAHAASAGTYILYASHVAAMAPSTNLGAATPITMDGSGGLGSEEEGEEKKDSTALDAKMVEDASAYIRGLAERHGRNIDWAESAVKQAKSLTAREAKEKKVIEFVAADIESLLAAIDGHTVTVNGTEVTLKTAGVTIERKAPDWRVKFLQIITDPNIALLLMTLGAYGLIYEFANPGVFVPGVIGLICLVIGLYAMNVLPVNYAGLALIFLGIAFMVGEAFAPSFGILGIGGAVAFAIGATILIDTEVPEFQIAWQTIAGITAVSMGLLVFLLGYILKATRGKVTTGAEVMIGSAVEIVDWKNTQGHVRYGGELWHAETPQKSTYKPGATVYIQDMKGLKLIISDSRGDASNTNEEE